MRRSQNGEFFQQYRLVVDMHSVYLVAKELFGSKGIIWWQRNLEDASGGEILVFCLTFVLLRGHLFASIET